MTAERRLAKLEGALSPKAATLLWLGEAQQFRSLPAYVAWPIDQPISAAPLERVPEQARAAAVESMRGQPREAVQEASRGGQALCLPYDGERPPLAGRRAGRRAASLSDSRDGRGRRQAHLHRYRGVV